jgi:hypothetical protein
MEYKHTQVGYVLLSLMVPACVVLFIFILSGSFGETEGWILTVTFLMMCAATFNFSTLTVKVTHSEIVWYFGPGLWTYRIKLSEVKEVRTGRSHPAEGIGIRWNPWKGWLYNVSGLRNVEILREDGKLTRIGTDEPEKLQKAIQERL